MIEVYKQIPLYRFLAYCNDSNMDKIVLDCGAGGDQPPLCLFAQAGYQIYGLELNEEQLEKAQNCGLQKGQELNIALGNMCNMEFDDDSFSFVYSYNSVFHMKKIYVEQAIQEMKRVLRPGGLLFVNFLRTSDCRCGIGPQVGDHEYEQMDDFPVIHSYYEKEEPDHYFDDMEILYKEDRVLERIYEGSKIRQGFIDYIVRKAL